MSHEGGPESTQQRTVAELLAMYGGDNADRAPRRRRRRDETSDTAPQTIIERVNSESSQLAPIRDDQPPPSRTSHRPRPSAHQQPSQQLPVPPRQPAPQARQAPPPPKPPVPQPHPPNPAPRPQQPSQQLPAQQRPPAPPRQPSQQLPRPQQPSQQLPAQHPPRPVPPQQPSQQLPRPGIAQPIPPTRPVQPHRPGPPPQSMPSGSFPGPGAPPAAPLGSGYFPVPQQPGRPPEPYTEQMPRVGSQAPPAGFGPAGSELRNGFPELEVEDDRDDDYEDYSDYADEGADEDEFGDELDERDKAPSAGREWLIMIVQVAVSVVAGAGVWLGFNWLWGRYPQAALVAALVVIVGLVWIVRKIRRADDLQTTLLAVLVGLFVTVSPAALLLLSR